MGGHEGVPGIVLRLLEPERDALLRAHFAALGIGVFEFARAWWGSVQPMRQGVHIDGLEHLQAARARGKGVILVSGHFTTLEICGRLLCDHLPVAGMYRPHAQPAMEWAVRRGRLPRWDVVTIAGMRCTSLERTAVDLARTAPPARAVQAILTARARGATRQSLFLALQHCRGGCAVGRPRAQRIIDALLPPGAP